VGGVYPLFINDPERQHNINLYWSLYCDTCGPEQGSTTKQNLAIDITATASNHLEVTYPGRAILKHRAAVA
jgi:hypothetical protein